MYSILLACVLIKAAIASLDSKHLPFEKRKLFVPPLQEIAFVLNEGLKAHYSEVQVDVVDCPDLTQPPFTLTNVGLNGKTRLVAVGDLRYAFPIENFTNKTYDMFQMLQALDLNSAFVLGASAGPREFVGSNCEGIFNVNIVGKKVDQQSVVTIIKEDDSYVLQKLPNNETRFELAADFFVSEGKPGPVLKIHVRKRIGRYSFGASIRKTLANYYGNKIISLGGTFILKEGKALQKAMANILHTPINSFKDIAKFYKRYNMSAPLIGVGTIVTGKYDLDLHLQHFHSFSHHGDGGHYKIDTTPEIAEYLGYFNTAEYAYHIDRVPVTNDYQILIDNNEDFF